MKVPYRTIAQIDAALHAPQMDAHRQMLDDTRRTMQPLIDLALIAEKNFLDSKHLTQFGLRL